MWNEPTDNQLAKLPKLYASENTPWEETAIHMHFFLAGCDWFMAEFGSEERIFFGYAILNQDLDNSEWGYTAFDEMRDLRIGPLEIDRDRHWGIRKASEVEKIVKAYRHKGLL